MIVNANIVRLLDTIREQCQQVGFDWPSNDTVRTGPPERVIYSDPNECPDCDELCEARSILATARV